MVNSSTSIHMFLSRPGSGRVAVGPLPHPGRMLGQMDMPILSIILKYCAASPMAQHNGIAVCCRWANISWRQMHLRMIRDMLGDSLDMLRVFHTAQALHLLVDLEDVM